MQLSSVGRAYTQHLLVKQQKQHPFVAVRQSQQQRSYRGLTASPCALDRHRLQIVFLTSEVAPWSKTGGLADVLSGLPAALAARGHRVMTVSPRYGDYVDVVDSGVWAPISLGGDMPPSGSCSSPTGSGAGTEAHTDASAAGAGTSGTQRSQEPPAQQNPAATMGNSKETAATGTEGSHSMVPVVKYYTSHTGDGVEYVFVDHPIFHAATYTGPDVGEVRDHPLSGVYMHTVGSDGCNIQTQYSVLCQAALAAPVLLWQDFAKANLSYGEQLQLHVLMQQVTQHAESQKEAAAQDTADAAVTLPREALALQYGVARPVSQYYAARQHLLAREADEGEDMLQLSAAFKQPHSDSVIFVGNDWPTGLLGLWLAACREQQGADQLTLMADYHPETLLAYLLQQQDEQLQQLRLQEEQQQLQQQEALLQTLQEQEQLLLELQLLLESADITTDSAGVLGGQAATVGSKQTSAADSGAVASSPKPAADSNAAAAKPAGTPAAHDTPPEGSQQSGSSQQQPKQKGRGSKRRVKQKSGPSEPQQQQAIQPSLPPEQSPAASPPQLTDAQPQQQRDALPALAPVAGAPAVAPASHAQAAAAAAPSPAADVTSDTKPPQQGPGKESKQQSTKSGKQHASQPGKQTAPDVVEEVLLSSEQQELSQQLPQESPQPTSAADKQEKQPSDERMLLQAAVEQQLLVQALQEVGKVDDQGAPVNSSSKAKQSKKTARWRRMVGAFQQLLGGPLRNAKFVFTIHNFAHQGLFSDRSFGATGLPGDKPPSALLTDTQEPLETDTASKDQTSGSEGQPVKDSITPPQNQLAVSDGRQQQLSADQMQQDPPLAGGMTPASGSVSTGGHQLNTAAEDGPSNAKRGRGRRRRKAGSSSGSGGSAGGTAGIASAAGQQQQAATTAADETSIKQRLPPSDAAVTTSPQLRQADQQQLSAASQSAASPEASARQNPWQAVWSAAQKQASAFLSWLQAGLVTSDLVVTVSPQHAREIQDQADQARNSKQPQQPQQQQHSTGAEVGPHSEKLFAAIREKGVVGIMNGVDGNVWSPQTDAYLPSRLRYGIDTVHRKKAAAKALLQSRMGLRLDPDVPLLAFVGRLEEQKGADVLLAALPQLLGPLNPDMMDIRTGNKVQLTGTPTLAGPYAVATGTLAVQREPQVYEKQQQQRRQQQPIRQQQQQQSSVPGCQLQVVMLGAGQEWQEACVTQLSAAWPGRAVGHAGFNEPLAHLIMAAADFLVVPSRFEPCGLVALCALRYGTVPIVSPVGGLLHAVQPGSLSRQSATTSKATDSRRARTTGCLTELGFVLPSVIGSASDPGSVRASANQLAQCIQEAAGMYGTEQFMELRVLCMQQDVSWDASAAAWEEALQALLSSPQQQP